MKWMIGLLLLYVIFILVSFVLVFVSWFIMMIGEKAEDKMSPFECGFVSFCGSRLTFSLQFFLIAMIFLIFDVEIALVLPIPVIYGFVDYGVMVLVFFVFGLVVVGGLYYEWGCGVLDWAY